MHSLALLPAWLANFAPIAGLLIVLSVALFILRSILGSKLPVTYSWAYRRRRIMNWLPLGLTYAFLYMGRYNINVVKTVLDPETGVALLTKAELGVITVIIPRSALVIRARPVSGSKIVLATLML